MENLALVILGSVGALFILVLVFFIMSQKKQDKADLENARKILENLTIDIKSATEDIDLDTIEEETADQEIAETTPSSIDEAIPVINEQPVVTASKPDSEVIVQMDTTPLSENPPLEEDVFKIQSGSAVTDYEEELHIKGISEFEYDSSKEEFDESDIEIFEIKVDTEVPQSDSKHEEDFIEGPAESLFEMMDNQNELVLDMDEEIVEALPAFDHDIHVNSFEDTLGEPDVHPEDIKVQDQNLDEMSELEALFEVSSDVEEKVFSAKKPLQVDLDIIPEIPVSQTPVEPIPPSKPLATSTEQDSKESPPAGEAPVVKPTESVTESEVTEPKADSSFDLENQKRHEKAKRIARVIVNDIRNYNPDNLAEGIRISNIMKTLGKEVERGRLLYIKRVPPDIVKETNYYREALINILADGRPELLGF